MNIEIPFAKIPKYPDAYTPGNVVGRFTDALGFRFYWATEGLREKDLNYKPGNEGMSVSDTIYHIYDITRMIESAVAGNVYDLRIREKHMTFEKCRSEILKKLEKLSEYFKALEAEEFEKTQISFLIREKQYDHPFWNIINGPISDGLYHVGQLVSFRRTCGNPIDPDVRVFLGIKLDRKKK